MFWPQNDTLEQWYSFLLLRMHQAAIYTKLFLCSIINGRMLKQRVKMYQAAKTRNAQGY